jgi:hypothetical protein
MRIRDKAKGLFPICSSIQDRIRMLIFVEGGKPESQEKNPCDKEENQQTTQLT